MEARLTAVQEYVKSQWMGTEYIDGPNEFHGDFGNFRVIGCTLVDLGERGGPDGTPEYWDWTWKDLNRFSRSAPNLSLSTARCCTWNKPMRRGQSRAWTTGSRGHCIAA